MLSQVSDPFSSAAPKGFNPFEDRSDGYKFLYPFGWQEVAVKGTDIVFKDVVEPLESVSVTLTKTDKKDITEFGEIQEVGWVCRGAAGAPNALAAPRVCCSTHQQLCCWWLCLAGNR